MLTWAGQVGLKETGIYLNQTGTCYYLQIKSYTLLDIGACFEEVYVQTSVLANPITNLINLYLILVIVWGRPNVILRVRDG